MKTVLVLGSGGREHAISWKMAQSPRVKTVITAPGNDGWQDGWERWADVDLGSPKSYAALAERARKRGVDLAVIGPDNPLAEGLADALIAQGVPVFGPRAAASRIEASKRFAKEVMEAAGVPTARYFHADSKQGAKNVVERLSAHLAADSEADWGRGWVVKVDGLALGKGVRVCETPQEAIAAIDAFSEGPSAQASFVIEERLFGEELSWMAFCEGRSCALLEPARDHKRLCDGDLGPNTGGMGAYSPVEGIPAELEARVKEQVFQPVLAELERRGCAFSGVLYAGLMFDAETGRFWVLEFNARFGDPEAQVLLLRMKDDLYSWCEAVAQGALDKMPGKVTFVADAAAIVVAASGGYPERPETGQLVHAGDLAPPQVFFAGVKKKNGELFTSGGRVFGVTGTGSDVTKAADEAYRVLESIRFDGMQTRRDIGRKRGGAS